MTAQRACSPMKGDTAEREDGILLKDGCWEIRDIRAHISKVYSLKSYIAHHCPETTGTYYWYSLPLIDDMCHGCKEYPPEGIMGLWKLHNMDYIQAGVSY